MEKTRSLWSCTANAPRFPSLEGNISTDVLVVGGGMAGILCAYYLSKRGVDYILVEGGNIGGGITQNSTAVVSAQHDVLYSDLIKKFGDYKAKQYLDANLEAVKEFREISKSIECDFEDKPSFIYSRNNAPIMSNEADAVYRLGGNAEFVMNISLPIEIAGAVMFSNAGQFHPLKFIFGISHGLRIYEDTYVKKIEKDVAYTARGNIKANKIIIATHYPFINSHGLFVAKLYQKRSYVIALEGAGDIGGTYVDNCKNGMYFRNYNDLLLIGGGDHRTGMRGGNFNKLRRFAAEVYPDAREKYAWATQDCMSLDGVPYIGAYSQRLPNIFVATGFNEWGMTSSMVSGKILCDAIMGKANRNAEVFSPDRSMMSMGLFTNFTTTVLNFLTPGLKRCPHMGCLLKWNKVEHTWDCPCHGSRFNNKGNLIDNPAMRDANVK